MFQLVGKLVEAVQTTKQNSTKPPPNSGYRLPLPPIPVQPSPSAFASWNKMGPQVPFQNFFPVPDPRTGFVPPHVNVPFNQPFMGQPLMVNTFTLTSICFYYFIRF